MSRVAAEGGARTRRVAALLIAISLAIVAGRIATVTSPEGDTAFLSANDRSRWATVAALVDYGTYEIDRLTEIRDKSGRRRPWQTIDRVRHTGRDGMMHDYSSKPPLLSTLIAGVYAGVRAVTGLSLVQQPIYVARIVLALFNLPLLAIFLVSVWRSIRAVSEEGPGALATLAVACFGTMVLPMAITLGNHLPAAAATALVLAIYLGRGHELGCGEGASPSGDRIRRPWALWGGAFVAGLAAAFTVACELPALLMLVLWAGLFYPQDRPSAWFGFVPGAVLVGAAFFGTNWAANGSWIPPYMHRGDGPVIGSLQVAGEPKAAAVAEVLAGTDELHPIHRDAPMEVVATDSPDRRIVEVGGGNQRFALVASEAGPFDGRREWEIRRWDHWYDYPGSYWMTPRKGVDRGEPSRVVYAFHATFGHHGLFSLTPFWLLVPLGLWLRLREPPGSSGWWMAVATGVATLICFAFYIARPLIDRNYGGVSCCFRWLLWFAPLWLWSAHPAADRLARGRWGEWCLIGLVAASVFSVATALDSPWRHPWIYRYLEFLGWIGGGDRG